MGAGKNEKSRSDSPGFFGNAGSMSVGRAHPEPFREDDNERQHQNLQQRPRRRPLQPLPMAQQRNLQMFLLLHLHQTTHAPQEHMSATELTARV